PPTAVFALGPPSNPNSGLLLLFLRRELGSRVPTPRLMANKFLPCRHNQPVATSRLTGAAPRASGGKCVKYFVMFRESSTERKAMPRSVKIKKLHGEAKGSAAQKRPRVSGAEDCGGT